MAYATKYYYTFTNLQGDTVEVRFQNEGYVGSAVLVDASTQPCVLNWDGDATDLFNPIRSAQATFVVYGIDLTEFAAANETDWKTVVLLNNNIIYEGFVIGDDSPQKLIYGDFPVQINATDGIGLLKNRIYPVQTTDQTIYEIIKTCLDETGLVYDLEFYANLWPTGVTTGHWADDVKTRRYFVAKGDGEYLTIYEVLRQVLISIGGRLYQSGGRWVIDRPGDYRKFPAGVPGALYDAGGYDSNITLTQSYEDLQPIGSSQMKTALRPVKRVRYEFDYTIPILVENANLQQLGTLIGTFTEGANTVYRYNALKWQEQNNAVLEIRVVRNAATDVEIDRYLWSEFKASNNSAGTGTDAFLTNEFPIDEGDNFSLTFQYRADTNSTQNKDLGLAIAIQLANGDIRRLQTLNATVQSERRAIWNSSFGLLVPTWTNMGVGRLVRTPGTFDITQQQIFDAVVHDESGNNKLPSFPLTAVNMKIFIHGFNNISGSLADLNIRVNDFSFNYEFRINDQKGIIGEFFNSEIVSVDFRTRIDEKLYICDSPKLLAKGTMYTGSFVKTAKWATTPTGTREMTFAEMQVKDRHNIEGNWRDVLEGDFFGVAFPKGFFRFDFLPDADFVATRLNVDLLNCVTGGSFYQVGGQADPTKTYTNNYLWQPRT